MDSSSDCGMLIKLISDNISRISNNELRSNNLTLSQLRYLEYLYAAKDTPTLFKDLETHFEVSQPTAAGIIKRLSNKGLIRTQDSELGGKAKTAVLTEAGKELFESAESRRTETERVLLAPLAEEDRVRFHSMLEQIYNHLKETE